jgi:predicted RNA-binding protein with PIN domain
MDLSLENARSAIVTFLLTHRQPGREKITVVFDGSAEILTPRATKVHGIEVVFSEPGVNADEVIRRMVASSPNPRIVLVVTADREIRSSVIAGGAKVVTPINFILRAEEESEKRRKAPPREPKEKYTGPPPGQVDQWRKIFGFDKEEPNEEGGEMPGGKKPDGGKGK